MVRGAKVVGATITGETSELKVIMDSG